MLNDVKTASFRKSRLLTEFVIFSLVACIPHIKWNTSSIHKPISSIHVDNYTGQNKNNEMPRDFSAHPYSQHGDQRHQHIQNVAITKLMGTGGMVKAKQSYIEKNRNPGANDPPLL